MRIVAIIATYNEERYMTNCLEHLCSQGIEVYLLDNCSTDRTVEIAERYRGRGLIDIETLPRDGVFSLRAQLERKEELALTLDADWFIHQDADEIRMAPRSNRTLAEALEEVQTRGYNAVNCVEFTFTPTAEDPDHDHPRYLDTLRWYYPFVPPFTHGLKAWARRPDRVQLAASGGHQVHFPGVRMYPVPFRMKHYPYLSQAHVVEKYVSRGYDAGEQDQGWHDWRARLDGSSISFPSQARLRYSRSDNDLDASRPWTRHHMATAARGEER